MLFIYIYQIFNEEKNVHHINVSCLVKEIFPIQIILDPNQSLKTSHSCAFCPSLCCTFHITTHNSHIFFSQKLLTIHSVFLASLFSSPNVSNNCSISFCRVALRSSAAPRALSDSTIFAWTTWYQCRCCVRFVFSRTTSTCSSSFLCSRLVIHTREKGERQEHQNEWVCM